MSIQWTSLKLKLATNDFVIIITIIYLSSLTFGVNMWAMPSTAPLSIKPRTRKQKSTRYGKRELKYITWVRRESSTLHSVAMDTLFGGFTVTHSSFLQTRVRREWIPQTTLCLFGAECANLWNLSKCEENSLRFREMSQISSSQYFTGTISVHLLTRLLNLECKKKNSGVLLTVVAGCCAVLYDSLSGWRLQDLVPAVMSKRTYSICIKPIYAYFCFFCFFPAVLVSLTQGAGLFRANTV